MPGLSPQLPLGWKPYLLSLPSPQACICYLVPLAHCDPSWLAHATPAFILSSMAELEDFLFFLLPLAIADILCLGGGCWWLYLL